VLSASGKFFQNPENPQPMIRVGNPGDTGNVEMSDLLFSHEGQVPGAILVEWNIKESFQGSAGMWDCHFRVGGAAGTQLQSSNCNAGQSTTTTCQGAFLGLHITQSASFYNEGSWMWTADHDLDGGSQLSIFTGRGIFIESQGPVWLYGTAAEHNVMYQYQIANAQNVILGMIQIETPYFQSSPKAPEPFVTNNTWFDPDFSSCSSSSATCAMAWGVRVLNSSNVFLYGAGLYSFFNNYNQACLKTESCQDSIVSIEANVRNFYLYNLNTEASTSMLNYNEQTIIKQSDNTNTFCQTAMAYLAEA